MAQLSYVMVTLFCLIISWAHLTTLDTTHLIMPSSYSFTALQSRIDRERKLHKCKSRTASAFRIQTLSLRPLFFFCGFSKGRQWHSALQYLS
ncbi:hypothetical protein WN944_013235 [Citrus x changshan-huyou]|uniref:Secreted protein n=1 Tax=Citrus x changshan-huyou TaxID=2935761 RepID=A0AAP0QNU8_9ROSI